jgi:hypothetical protein
MPSPFKNHLYAVISGTVQVRHGKIIQTIANYLREGETTSADTKGSKQFKAQERQRLKSYLSNHHLWVERIDLHQYVSEGAEQKVFLNNSLPATYHLQILLKQTIFLADFAKKRTPFLLD